MRGQYLTRGGIGASARLFLCAGCRLEVLICSRCDRGNIYCGKGCASEARRIAQRAAQRRYQSADVVACGTLRELAAIAHDKRK